MENLDSIKKIPVSLARAGMYVDLDHKWLEHDFLRNRFMLDEKALAKLRASGIREIIIDTSKGLDVAEEPSPEPQKVTEEQPVTPVRAVHTEDIGYVVQQAREAFSAASSTIRNLMNDVRSGKELKPEMVESTAERLIQSIEKSPQTLNAVTRIKTRDEYTFQHCIGVASLLTGFADIALENADIEEIMIGGIVHDIGKIHVPDEILNKPAKLTDEEFVLMKKHVTFSREIFEENRNFTRTQTDIALLHHERPDGKGYPLGLKDGEISEIGYMGAVVDVYDALSTRRVYKKAWEPSQALKSMLEWGPGQFNQDILKRFISYLGIYPVGTWVLLESNRVGFVLSQNEDKLRPVVQMKLSVRDRRLLNEEINLSAKRTDAIKQVVSPVDYGLDDDFDV